MVNNVQETRAVGAAWGSDDRIGVTVEADEDNATANAVDTYINIQYCNETGGSFRVVNEGSTDNNIRLKGEGEFTLNAYYTYQGANGTLPGTEGVIAKTISGADQTTDSTSFLYIIHHFIDISKNFDGFISAIRLSRLFVTTSRKS